MAIDKTAQVLLTNAETVINQQKDEMKVMSQKIAELEHHKLAMDVTRILVDNDEVDAEDIIDSVDQLLSKSAEDLQKRAQLLSVSGPSHGLDLGTPSAGDEGSKLSEPANPASPRGEQSTAMARQVITSFLSTD